MENQENRKITGYQPKESNIDKNNPPNPPKEESDEDYSRYYYKCVSRLKGVNGTICVSNFGKSKENKNHMVRISIPLNNKKQIERIDKEIDRTSANKKIKEGIISIKDSDKDHIKMLTAEILITRFDILPYISYKVLDKMLNFMFNS